MSYFMLRAIFSASYGVLPAMAADAAASGCLLATTAAVFCKTSFSISLLNHFAPPNPMMRALAISLVENVNAGVPPKMTIDFAAHQEPSPRARRPPRFPGTQAGRRHFRFWAGEARYRQ
jgi:hypothetical protein